MNDPRIILDTGPLVAILVKDDIHHHWALHQAERFHPPFLTCDAVLTEALFLLQHRRNGREGLFGLLRNGAVLPRFAMDREHPTVGNLMAKYATVPMSLADACLVRMSEQMEDSVVLTCDTYFRIYRKFGRHPIPHIAPWQ